MKAGLHPEYKEATIRCACGATVQTHSVKGDLDTIMAGLACGDPSPIAFEKSAETSSVQPSNIDVETNFVLAPIVAVVIFVFLKE